MSSQRDATGERSISLAKKYCSTAGRITLPNWGLRNHPAKHEGLWVSDDMEDKRTALKLVFTEKLPYNKKEGFAAAPIALPFRLLSDLEGGKNKMVRLTRLNTNLLFEILETWESILKECSHS